MNIGIVGSRRFTNKQKVINLVKSLPKDTTVVSGGCRGVDTWAEDAAKEIGLKTLILKPDLTGCVKYYDFAERFYARNRSIVEHSDLIYAFVMQDRKGGTENTIKWANKMNKKVVIEVAEE